MKTNLAYIDDVFEGAVAAQINNPQVPEEFEKRAQKKTVIAGFEVLDKVAAEKAREKGREARRMQLQDYREARTALSGSLAERGVTPLAILPVAAWKRVCSDAGLIKLEGNTLRVNFAKAFSYIEKRVNSRTVDAAVANIAEDYLARKSWGEFITEIMADRDAYDTRLAQVRIKLPEPPESVVDVLVRVRDLAPKTVAVPDAIMFANDPATEIAKAYGRHVEEEKRRREYEEWLKHDPIVFVENDNATAIVAQFGDFPIEKELVERVSKTEFFPLRGTQRQPPSLTADADYMSPLLARSNADGAGLPRTLVSGSTRSSAATQSVLDA